MTISRVREISKSFDHLKIGLVGKSAKTKHISYKNHGLEMNGSKDIAILAFLLMKSSKFKMAIELRHVGIFL